MNRREVPMRSPFVDEIPRRTEQLHRIRSRDQRGREGAEKETESGFVLCIRVKESRGLHLHHCGKGEYV
jgi:hypothetical protein